MEGRFNQDLPESLQAAIEKATNFLTKQTINTRRMNEVNQINETLTIQVRTMIPTIKIKTKTTVIIITPAAVPATQGLDITSTTTTMEHQPTPKAHSRVSQLMYKLPSLDQSTGTNCLKFRKS